MDAQVRADLAAVPDGVLAGTGPDGSRSPGVRRSPPWTSSCATGCRGSGPHEDAMLAGDPWMAHSLLSAPMNLGLLDPLEVVLRRGRGVPPGRAPLAATEGFIRQVLGWREYIWHLYWWLPDDYRTRNALSATASRSRSGGRS